MGEWFHKVFPLPVVASAHGAEVDRVIVLIHIIMAVAFTVWGVFLLVPLVRNRRRRRPVADYRGLRSKLPYVFVVLVAAAELVLLLGLSLPFWERVIAAEPDPDEDLFRVRIVAQQFVWNVHYPGPDGLFGRTLVEEIDDQINPLGLDPEDPAGKDDVVKIHQLHVPVGQKVEIQLTSKDVIHSLFLPEFRVKQDAIPGMSVPVRFVPTMTTEELRAQTGDDTRDFEMVCAQLCGLSHFRMRGFLTVETQEAFDTWYAQELEYKVEW